MRIRVIRAIRFRVIRIQANRIPVRFAIGGNPARPRSERPGALAGFLHVCRNGRRPRSGRPHPVRHLIPHPVRHPLPHSVPPPLPPPAPPVVPRPGRRRSARSRRRSARSRRRSARSGSGGAVGPSHSRRPLSGRAVSGRSPAGAGRLPAGSFPRAPDGHSVGHRLRHHAAARGPSHAVALPDPVRSIRGIRGIRTIRGIRKSEASAARVGGRRSVAGPPAPRDTTPGELPRSLSTVSGNGREDNGREDNGRKDNGRGRPAQEQRARLEPNRAAIAGISRIARFRNSGAGVRSPVVPPRSSPRSRPRSRPRPGRGKGAANTVRESKVSSSGPLRNGAAGAARARQTGDSSNRDQPLREPLQTLTGRGLARRGIVPPPHPATREPRSPSRFRLPLRLPRWGGAPHRRPTRHPRARGSPRRRPAPPGRKRRRPFPTPSRPLADPLPRRPPRRTLSGGALAVPGSAG